MYSFGNIIKLSRVRWRVICPLFWKVWRHQSFKGLFHWLAKAEDTVEVSLRKLYMGHVKLHQIKYLDIHIDYKKGIFMKHFNVDMKMQTKDSFMVLYKLNFDINTFNLKLEDLWFLASVRPFLCAQWMWWGHNLRRHKTGVKVTI